MIEIYYKFDLLLLLLLLLTIVNENLNLPTAFIENISCQIGDKELCPTASSLIIDCG
jgi:hypothetical protein